ncbi:MAG: cydB [Gammaproteobacteria bacterium]|jgi:cytochrome d ubiquinol oxidase subunit II|nr:cydB [Gammaproteobacteria bacterium]
MFDYTTLRIIWWFLLGLVLIGFAIMDGFDLGAVILLPWVTKDDLEKRIVINTVGPVWEGNQVWIILGGGAIFAAWPFLYAAAFSGFYLAMFITLAGFILRPVSFKYRSKLPNPTWRKTWDILLTLSGFIPSLIFGVAVGNVLQGVPFHFDEMLRFYYTGSFFGLLNPFALLCGLLSVFMLCMHGAVYLCSKTQEEIQSRTRVAAMLCAGVVICLFGVGGLWVQHFISGYALVQQAITDGPSNPLHKQMIMTAHQLLQNYSQYPFFKTAPVLGFAGALLTILLCWKKHFRLAFISSACSIAGVITTVGVSLFPILLPSSSNPSQSLLIWDASSSKGTLGLMLVAGIIFLPIIIAYTAWVYRIMKGPVTKAMFGKESGSMY